MVVNGKYEIFKMPINHINIHCTLFSSFSFGQNRVGIMHSRNFAGIRAIFQQKQLTHFNFTKR